MMGGENKFFRWQRRHVNQLQLIKLIDAKHPVPSLFFWENIRYLTLIILVKVYTDSQHDLLK